MEDYETWSDVCLRIDRDASLIEQTLHPDVDPKRDFGETSPTHESCLVYLDADLGSGSVGHLPEANRTNQTNNWGGIHLPSPILEGNEKAIVHSMLSQSESITPANSPPPQEGVLVVSEVMEPSSPSASDLAAKFMSSLLLSAEPKDRGEHDPFVSNLSGLGASEGLAGFQHSHSLPIVLVRPPPSSPLMLEAGGLTSQITSPEAVGQQIWPENQLSVKQSPHISIGSPDRNAITAAPPPPPQLKLPTPTASSSENTRNLSNPVPPKTAAFAYAPPSPLWSPPSTAKKSACQISGLSSPPEHNKIGGLFGGSSMASSPVENVNDDYDDNDNSSLGGVGRSKSSLLDEKRNVALNSHITNDPSRTLGYDSSGGVGASDFDAGGACCSGNGITPVLCDSSVGISPLQGASSLLIVSLSRMENEAMLPFTSPASTCTTQLQTQILDTARRQKQQEGACDHSMCSIVTGKSPSPDDGNGEKDDGNERSISMSINDNSNIFGSPLPRRKQQHHHDLESQKRSSPSGDCDTKAIGTTPLQKRQQPGNIVSNASLTVGPNHGHVPSSLLFTETTGLDVGQRCFPRQESPNSENKLEGSKENQAGVSNMGLLSPSLVDTNQSNENQCENQDDEYKDVAATATVDNTAAEDFDSIERTTRQQLEDDDDVELALLTAKAREAEAEAQRLRVKLHAATEAKRHTSTGAAVSRVEEEKGKGAEDIVPNLSTLPSSPPPPTTNIITLPLQHDLCKEYAATAGQVSLECSEAESVVRAAAAAAAAADEVSDEASTATFSSRKSAMAHLVRNVIESLDPVASPTPQSQRMSLLSASPTRAAAFAAALDDQLSKPQAQQDKLTDEIESSEFWDLSHFSQGQGDVNGGEMQTEVRENCEDWGGSRHKHSHTQYEESTFDDSEIDDGDGQYYQQETALPTHPSLLTLKCETTTVNPEHVHEEQEQKTRYVSDGEEATAVRRQWCPDTAVRRAVAAEASERGHSTVARLLMFQKQRQQAQKHAPAGHLLPFAATAPPQLCMPSPAVANTTAAHPTSSNDGGMNIEGTPNCHDTDATRNGGSHVPSVEKRKGPKITANKVVAPGLSLSSVCGDTAKTVLELTNDNINGGGSLCIDASFTNVTAIAGCKRSRCSLQESDMPIFDLSFTPTSSLSSLLPKPLKRCQQSICKAQQQLILGPGARGTLTVTFRPRQLAAVDHCEDAGDGENEENTSGQEEDEEEMQYVATLAIKREQQSSDGRGGGAREERAVLKSSTTIQLQGIVMGFPRLAFAPTTPLTFVVVSLDRWHTSTASSMLPPPQCVTIGNKSLLSACVVEVEILGGGASFFVATSSDKAAAAAAASVVGASSFTSGGVAFRNKDTVVVAAGGRASVWVAAAAFSSSSQTHLRHDQRHRSPHINCKVVESATLLLRATPSSPEGSPSSSFRSSLDATRAYSIPLRLQQQSVQTALPPQPPTPLLRSIEDSQQQHNSSVASTSALTVHAVGGETGGSIVQHQHSISESVVVAAATAQRDVVNNGPQQRIRKDASLKEVTNNKNKSKKQYRNNTCAVVSPVIDVRPRQLELSHQKKEFDNCGGDDASGDDMLQGWVSLRVASQPSRGDDLSSNNALLPSSLSSHRSSSSCCPVSFTLRCPHPGVTLAPSEGILLPRGYAKMSKLKEKSSLGASGGEKENNRNEGDEDVKDESKSEVVWVKVQVGAELARWLRCTVIEVEVSGGGAKRSVPLLVHGGHHKLPSVISEQQFPSVQVAKEHRVFFKGCGAMVNFGSIPVGNLATAKMKLCNAGSLGGVQGHEDEGKDDGSVEVVVGDPGNPFVLLHHRIVIRDRSYVNLPLRFLPTARGGFETTLPVFLASKITSSGGGGLLRRAEQPTMDDPFAPLCYVTLIGTAI